MEETHTRKPYQHSQEYLIRKGMVPRVYPDGGRQIRTVQLEVCEKDLPIIKRYLSMHYRRRIKYHKDRKKKTLQKLRKLRILLEAHRTNEINTMPLHQRQTLSDWQVELIGREIPPQKLLSAPQTTQYGNNLEI